ncbi:MAG: hypothetical protein F6K31_28400 [Symploca sp. SIO2G7]|nr:hypothetical protein [Symploca sp. SIO2G7]
MQKRKAMFLCKSIIIALALTNLLSSSAIAQTDEERNAIKHILQNKCDYLTSRTLKNVGDTIGAGFSRATYGEERCWINTTVNSSNLLSNRYLFGTFNGSVFKVKQIFTPMEILRAKAARAVFGL